VDVGALKVTLWFLLSDVLLFLDTKLFALIRGLLFNLLSGRVSVAYIYKRCTFNSFRDIELGRNTVIKKRCRFSGPIAIGKNTTIDQGAILTGPLTIGRQCYVNYEAWIDRHVTLADRVGIGHRSFIVTFAHESSDPGGRWLGDLQFDPIEIEEGAWVGAHVVIVPGVTVGHGSIIGAGSVVTKDVPPDVLFAGNPATVRKSLNYEDADVAELEMRLRQ